MSVSSAGTTNPLCVVFILYNITFNPMPALQKWLEYSVLAATYSCLTTTIGADGLNCRVRNENGCNTVAKPPTHNIRFSSLSETCSLKTEGDNLKERIFYSPPSHKATKGTARLSQFLSRVLIGGLVRLGSSDYSPST